MNECNFCGSKNMVLVPADFPWHTEYWMCLDCCSTYCYEDTKC